MNTNYLPNNAIVTKGFEFNYNDSKSIYNRKNNNKKNKRKFKNNKRYNNNNINNNNFNLNFENENFSLGISTPIPNIGNLLVQSLGNALFKK